jgi:hypothetical protein
MKGKGFLISLWEPAEVKEQNSSRSLKVADNPISRMIDLLLVAGLFGVQALIASRVLLPIAG